MIRASLMSLQLRTLTSLTQLRAESGAWDDLWMRSTIAAPIARAELTAQWIEASAARSEFRAVIVEADGEYVAALPLVGSRKAGLRIGILPPREWCRCGGLLWDPTYGREAIDTLLLGLHHLPWSIFWLDGIPLEEPRWQEFIESLRRAGLPWQAHIQDHVGVVDCRGSWEKFQANWSGNHRRHMRKALRKAETEGGVELKIYRDFESPEQIAELVKQGFEVEDRSWKGSATQSSVLKSPGSLEFFVRQARQLAQWDQLQLVFLEFGGRPVAFEYGWIAKGTYFTPKVGYDEQYSRFTPGQLLRYLLYERFHIERSVEKIDFAGELSVATAKWTTSVYPISRLVFSSGTAVSRAAISIYKAYRKFADSRTGPGANESAAPKDTEIENAVVA